MITLVVFSKDRAMQLDSLLRSVRDNCTGIDWIAAVVDASSDLHERAYDKLAVEYEELGGFRMLRQRAVGGLGMGLGAACKHGEHLALTVDDQLFYAPSDFRTASELLDHEKAFVWSWRLGVEPGMLGKTYGSGKLVAHAWQCSALSSDPDYGYLWHSDGALYKTADYRRMLDRFLPDWRTVQCIPNDLEAAVAGAKPDWAASVGPHLGPIAPTCITWQLNRVQTKYGSPAAEIPETQIDALAHAYLEGKRVDNEKLYEALRADPLRWNPPGARPTHVYACEEASKFWAGCVR